MNMKETRSDFRSGFITIVGRPNVGKSSLMNALIGEKIAIVSSKPQTTRNRIMGVVTHEQDQMVFLDTPGIHDPKTRLGDYMMHSVHDAMEGMDCLMVLLDASHITDKDRNLVEEMSSARCPRILVLNKLDLIHPEQILSIMAAFESARYDEIIPISAKTGDGLAQLTDCLRQHLPLGPKYFPEDMMTDQPERLLCAELIREKALRHLRDEVPHGIGVEMMSIQNIRDDLMEIHATIYCERAAHKGIIIGHQGEMLRTIGSEARQDIEALLHVHVNLKLWVKVRNDWRNNVSDLRNLGYEIKKN